MNRFAVALGGIGLGVLSSVGFVLAQGGPPVVPPGFEDIPPGFYRPDPRDWPDRRPPLLPVPRVDVDGVSAPGARVVWSQDPAPLPRGWVEPATAAAAGARGARSSSGDRVAAAATALPAVPTRVSPANPAAVGTPLASAGGVAAAPLRVNFVSTTGPVSPAVTHFYTHAGTGSPFNPPANRVWVQKSTTGTVTSSYAFGNGTYYWKSQACNPACSSLQSTDFRFNVRIAPAMVSPAMNTVIQDKKVTLTVKDGPGTPWGHMYRYNVAGGTLSGSSPVVYSAASTPSVTIYNASTTNPPPLMFVRGQSYDWAGQSCVAGDSGCTSQLFKGRFTIANVSTPVLAGPSANELIQTQTPTLRVDDTDGFVWHRKFQVFSFVNGVMQPTPLWQFDSTNRTRSAVTAVLPAGQKYAWRAQSCGAASSDCGVWSGLQEFTIAEPPALPVEQTFGQGCDTALGSTGCETEGAGGSGDQVVDGQNAGLSEASSDASIEGRGVPFSVSRSYASVDPTVDRFGAGWAFNLGVKLRIFLNGDVEVRGETGETAVYVKNPDGSFQVPVGANSKLVAITGGYTLTTLELQRYTFSSQGLLTSVKDETNQGLTLAYNAANDLTSVTNAEGKVVTVTTNPTTHLVTGFTMPAGDGRSVAYTYDASGRIATFTNMAGDVTTYRYDAQGRLDGVKEQITGTQERWRTRVVFNASGQVVSSQDAEGNTTTYSWSGTSAPGEAIDGVKTTTSPRGGVWKETYNDGVLVETEDPNGFKETFSYDAQMNLVRQTDKAGNATTMTYDANGNMLSKTSPGPTARTETWTYNANNDPLVYTNARGKQTTYQYYTTGASTGLLWKETNAKGEVTEYTYTANGDVATTKDARGFTTTNEYYPSGTHTGRLWRTTTSLGFQTIYLYDAKGRTWQTLEPFSGTQKRLTQNTYDDADRVTQVRTALATYNSTNNTFVEVAGTASVTSTVYDKLGRKTSETDANNKTTTYVYDLNDRQVSVTDPTNGVSTTEYDDDGNVEAEVTATGARTTYEYDLAGRQTAMVSPRGNVNGGTPANYRTTYLYDANGNQTRVTDPLGKQTNTTYDAANQAVTVTDPLGNVTTNTYDENGNQTIVTDALGRQRVTEYDNLDRSVGETSPMGFKSVTVYDANGNTIEQSTPMGFKTKYTFDADNRQVTMIEARGNVSGGTPATYTWNFTYNEAGNQLTERNPLNQTTTYTYDKNGSQLTKSDALSRVTTWRYDAGNRLTSVTGPDAPACSTGAQCVGGKKSTVYGYDNVGNVTSTTDPNGNVTTKAYDLANRLTEKVSPIGQKWTYGYDADGNQTTMVTARGNHNNGAQAAAFTITKVFDRRGLLTNVNYGSNLTANVTNTYDDAGRLVQTQDGAGTEVYTLDEVGRRIEVLRAGKGFRYDYDEDDRVIGRSYPDADQAGYGDSVVNATFDNDGRQTSVTKDDVTTTFGYDAAGNLTTTTFPSGNGHVETRTYDTAGRLTRVRAVKGTTVLVDTNQTLDAVGNPTLKVTTRGTAVVNETYAYDAADRLIRNCLATTVACTNTAANRIEYTYDPVGNRLTQVRVGTANNPGTTTYTYNTADQLTQTLRSGVTTTYAYDHDGNQTAEGASVFAYDHNNMTVSATVAGQATTYAYDASNKRLSETTGGQTTTMQWDTMSALPELALEMNPDGSVARRYTQGPLGPIMVDTPATVFFHADPIGSIVAQTNTAGVAQATYTYDPYGEQRATTGTPGNVRYAGERLDGTGLYHLRARQYQSGLGIFTTVDPLSPPSNLPTSGTYAYVSSRPTVLVDPTGEFGARPPKSLVRATTVREWFNVDIGYYFQVQFMFRRGVPRHVGKQMRHGHWFGIESNRYRGHFWIDGSTRKYFITAAFWKNLTIGAYKPFSGGTSGSMYRRSIYFAPTAWETVCGPRGASCTHTLFQVKIFPYQMYPSSWKDSYVRYRVVKWRKGTGLGWVK